jgi:hypothetical protein
VTLDPIQKFSLKSPIVDLNCSRNTAHAVAVDVEGFMYEWTPTTGLIKLSNEPVFAGASREGANLFSPW